jgi:hypothetical protein
MKKIVNLEVLLDHARMQLSMENLKLAREKNELLAENIELRQNLYNRNQHLKEFTIGA